MTVLIETIEEWKRVRDSLREKTVGFVPTMGNLHAGHMSLVSRSLSENDCTVLSSYVNPTQFNNNDDFEKYPRTNLEDIALCEQASVDYFLTPSYEEMYTDNYQYQVVEKKLSAIMEGEYRPEHFDGVLTIVLKLLLLVKPNRIYFGKKDYQQLQLVQGMVDAFFIDTDVVACETVRSDNGLALSSRNRRLSKDQMAIAHYIHEYLSSKTSCDDISEALQLKGFEVEYIKEYQGRRFAAVRLGDVRLIDNVEIQEEC